MTLPFIGHCSGSRLKSGHGFPSCVLHKDSGIPEDIDAKVYETRDRSYENMSAVL